MLFDVEDRKRFVDSKTNLQEHIQQISDIPIEYRVISEIGPDHNKTFTIHVTHDEKVIGKGEGRSKKSAEQRAAFDALKRIEKD